MISLKLFILGGAILIVTGVVQLFVRPREKHEVGLQRFVNAGTIKSAIFVLVGIFALLLGFGVVPIVPIRF